MSFNPKPKGKEVTPAKTDKNPASTEGEGQSGENAKSGQGNAGGNTKGGQGAGSSSNMNPAKKAARHIGGTRGGDNK